MRSRIRIVGLRWVRIGVLFAVLLPVSGHAFFVDGIWSGMTRQQLAAAATAVGLTIWPTTSGRWFIGTPWQARALGELDFCGDYLVSYSRDIHSDADYASTLASVFATYGPPRNMSVSGDVAAGATAGAMRASGDTVWTRGPDRVKMKSSFDWRMHQGELRREQPARIKFETLNPCRNGP